MVYETKIKKQTGPQETGEDCYLNNNCWLVKNLRYSPYKRCQYCELRFRKCLFLQYQIVSLVLVGFSFFLLLLFHETITAPVIIIVFTQIIVYGYFFGRSTERIIRSNFLEKKAKDELKELSSKLEEKVKEQTKDIRQQNRHLEDLLNMKSDFLRTVNHQMNTPLTIMKNAFAMMDDGSLSTEQGLKIAAHGLERMSSTVADFWDAYEMEERKVPVDLVETDIENIIIDMVKEKKKMELTIGRKLRIVVAKPNFRVPKVLCDQKKISHAISNLLDNAVFYTQKGSVKIWFEKVERGKKEYLKIFISDTGEGISREDQKKLFMKFSRGSAISSANPNGSGLGLYIAKNIVESSKGRLKLESSELGKGTTFSICLKAVRAAKAKK